MLARKILSSVRALGSVARSQRHFGPVLSLRVAKPVWQRKNSIFNSPLNNPHRHLLHTSRPVRIASAVTNLDPGAVHVAHSFLEQAIHVHWIQRFIGVIHSWGLPWYQAIAATTVLFRTIFLPLNIDLLRNSSRLNSIREELTKKEDALAKATSDEEKLKIATEVQDLFKERKCSPYKNIITPFLMIPVFVSIFFAVEGLSYLHPEMTTGGTLWFTDLSKPDPSYFLPIVSAVTWLATIEVRSIIFQLINVDPNISRSSILIILLP